MAKKFAFILTASLLAAFLARPAGAQDYAAAPWMALFNDGKYETVVTEIPKWLPGVAEERQGIPKYFLGESFYSLGLAETNAAKATEHFQNALKNFTEGLERDDLKVSTFLEQARYKRAWSLFRLAELGGNNPTDLLQQAYAAFSVVSPQAADDLPSYSAYMAGEARLRQATLAQYTMFSRELLAADINTIIGLLNDASRAFRNVAGQAKAPEELKLAAQIRLNDVYFQFGKLYQGVPAGLFGEVNDANKKANVVATANDYFARANYKSSLNVYAANVRRNAAPVVLYSDAVRLLNMYLTQADNQVSLAFTDKIDSLADSGYGAEKLFRRGNRDQANQNLKSQPFINLSLDNSYYARAAQSIPEASFWLAFVQNVLGQENALANFNAYLEKTGANAALRQQVLREEAQLRRYSLELENLMRLSGQKASQLRALQTNVQNFQPRFGRIQNENDKLLKRIQIAAEISRGGNQNTIAGRIYSSILNQNIDVAGQLIQELLPRAASTVGLSSAGYLEFVEILALILEEQRPDQAKFYRGIALSLSAEISPSQAEKKRLFQQSADILQGVGGPYRDEARYVRARSLFSAEVYDEAYNLLRALVNETQSLRALFYLGEYFRTQGNGVAAKTCFEIVKQKTQNAPGGTFWYNNADAAITLSNNAGDNRPLADVQYTAVNFPDATLRDDHGDPVTYEGLAESRFLQTQLARQGVELLEKFALPKRALYPSENLLVNSQIAADGIFTEWKAPINERPGAITAALRLVLVADQSAETNAWRVSLDDQPMSGVNGVYAKDGIKLGTTLRVQVENPEFYPYIRELVFSKPGLDTAFVLLSPKLAFAAQGKAGDDLATAFPERLDKNMILRAGTNDKLPQRSALYADIAANPAIRDFVYHPTLDAWLLVDAKNNRIQRAASSDVSLRQAAEFSLDFGAAATPSTLNSPEGIAIDADGAIYLADWGNHRILVCRMDGTVVRALGAFGETNTPGSSARLVFPTRIAIAEDATGLTYHNKTLRRPRLLYVADRAGVHLLDEYGHYLDTVVATNNRLAEGSFYGISAEGYGVESKLYLANRGEGDVVVFVGRGR